MNDEDLQLSQQQLETLRQALHVGAEQASKALSKWLKREAVISVDEVKQLPLQDATQVLGAGDQPVGFCATAIQGRLTGELILAFDDASGLMLTDLLLDRPAGTSSEWNEMEVSAALETANILGCAYLNSLARTLPPVQDGSGELLPEPPRFNRDFPECVVQFAVMGQAVASDSVLLAETEFCIDGAPVYWKLLFVPDATSMEELRTLLG